MSAPLRKGAVPGRGVVPTRPPGPSRVVSAELEAARQTVIDRACQFVAATRVSGDPGGLLKAERRLVEAVQNYAIDVALRVLEDSEHTEEETR